ncbi:MAG: penicillin-binding protein activator [Kofleriaceae bacterium]|nr:penicillin-binding protein activator [Kofleriaceae bacterium]
MSHLTQARVASASTGSYSARVIFARFLTSASVVALSLVLTACPGKRQVPTTNSTASTTLSLPTSGDASARTRFEMSRSRFEQNAEVDTSEDFEAIVRDYPNDPIVPHALLYGAMADLRGGDGVAAQEKLVQVRAIPGIDTAVIGRAALLNGFALLALGQKGQALADLKAGEVALDRGDAGEVSAWHAGIAESGAAAGQVALAIRHYDAWWATGTEAEKAYAADQIEALLPEIAESNLRALFLSLESQRGPAAARVGARLLPVVGAAEDTESRQLLTVILEAMRRAGLDSGLSGQYGPGNADIVGALLPMTGRLNRVGELSLRALILASGQSPKAGQNPSFQVLSRDTNSVAKLVQEGMQSLVQSEALAIIGPFDGRALKSALPLATAMGIPLISLAPRGSTGPKVYSIRHSAEARARVLAKHAYTAGIRDFAIFAPASSYGKVVARAFRLEVEKLGGTVVVAVEYPKASTSFKKHVGKLRKPWSAIFVPDVAKKLELIAPALAAANLHAMPVGGKSKRGRSILLLSTAEGLDASFLRSAGRYALGAVFAPGFYPDGTDSQIADFVLRYEEEFGVEPGVHEAYAYDAAAVVRHAVNAGAFTRDTLSRELYRQSVLGQTGTITFDSSGKRSDPGLLFQVKEPIAGQYELNALR